MFEGLPVEVLSLVGADGSVTVPPGMVPWLEQTLRAQLLRGRGNPRAGVVTFLKALVVGADRADAFSVKGSMPSGESIIELEGFLTSRSAAVLTGRTDRAIRCACASGRLPAVKVGNLWHIRPSDLDGYIHRRSSHG